MPLAIATTIPLSLKLSAWFTRVSRHLSCYHNLFPAVRHFDLFCLPCFQEPKITHRIFPSLSQISVHRHRRLGYFYFTETWLEQTLPLAEVSAPLQAPSKANLNDCNMSLRSPRYGSRTKIKPYMRHESVLQVTQRRGCPQTSTSLNLAQQIGLKAHVENAPILFSPQATRTNVTQSRLWRFSSQPTFSTTADPEQNMVATPTPEQSLEVSHKK